MILNKDALVSEAGKVMEFIANKLESVKNLKLEELDFSKTLLVIIDINNGFARGGALYSDRVENLITPIEELAKYIIKKEGTAVAFTDCHTEESPEFCSYPQHCMRGTTESEIIDELKTLDIKVIEKNSTNGFLEEAFNIDANIDNVIVVGDCTDICVYQFAVSVKSDFNRRNEHRRVIVPIEYVDTFNAPFHNGDFMNAVFLSSMMDNGIEVVKIYR